MGTLFVVATPIGNLQDLSIRCMDVLRSVSLVAAEDTRVTRKLLGHVGSKARTLSYNEHSPPGRLKQLLDHLDSGDLALVTDAGTPAISDPGSALVQGAAQAGHAVMPIPGPSAVTTALSVSGFGGTKFLFLGFLPRRKADRIQELESGLGLPATLVFLETPRRIRKTLEDLDGIAPERQLVMCRELTKLHEEVWRGTAAEALAHFDNPRGEFVVVVEPADAAKPEFSNDQIMTAAERAIASGLSGRSAVEQVISETGAPRARAYPAVLEAQKKT